MGGGGCRLINSWITSDESSNLQQRPGSGSGICECVRVRARVSVRDVGMQPLLTIPSYPILSGISSRLSPQPRISHVINRSSGVNNNTFVPSDQ